MFVPVNYVAIAASSIASMIVGFVWYSPLMFAKPWTKLMGIDMKKVKQDQSKMGPQYMLSLAASLIAMFVLAQVIERFSAMGASGGAAVGFMMWLGFTTTVQLTDWLFGGKKKELYLINTGYQLATLLIGGAIIGMMK